METLEEWLERKFLEWQNLHGRTSVRRWSDFLGVNYTTLMGMMSGEKEGTTMQTAYQIGERLKDFSILKVLGYPIPDVSLAGFPEEERSAILDWLESVKHTLDKVPSEERVKKLKTILDGMTDAETDVK